MEQTTIKVNISGREYPVNVLPNQLNAMKKAETAINVQINTYKSSYAIKDPRDLLAMCALQLAFQQQEKEEKERKNLEKVMDKVAALETALKIPH